MLNERITHALAHDPLQVGITAGMHTAMPLHPAVQHSRKGG